MKPFGADRVLERFVHLSILVEKKKQLKELFLWSLKNAFYILSFYCDFEIYIYTPPVYK